MSGIEVALEPEIHAGPVSLSATYDGTGHTVKVDNGNAFHLGGDVTLHLSEDDAQRLGDWLQRGAADEYKRRQEERRWHPPDRGRQE